jgi:hypothetical protein
MRKEARAVIYLMSAPLQPDGFPISNLRPFSLLDMIPFEGKCRAYALFMRLHTMTGCTCHWYLLGVFVQLMV